MSTAQLKILVISDFDGLNANVIGDFLFCFNEYSHHDYYYVFDPRVVNGFTDFSVFDVILIFWSVYLPSGTLLNSTRENIRKSRALKVLFLQDEYRDVNVFANLVSSLGIQLMFTLVQPEMHHLIYPRDVIPSIEAIHTVLTGYVPTYLESSRPPDHNARTIDIGYRSRALPYYLGDLARHKILIAQHFQELSHEHGFRSDISVREDDRIYGSRWVKFLQSSRFTLGSPSGVSVVDFTGDIRRNCENYLALNPQAPYEEVREKFFAEIDGKFVMDPLSPRIFEAVALGCTLVMVEGTYAGVLQPDRHYIRIKNDYSNLDDVVRQMKDSSYSRRMAEITYQELVASGEFSYRKFASWFDGVLDKHSVAIGIPGISKSIFYASNYFRYGQTLIPQNDRFTTLPGKKIFGYIDKFKKARSSLSPHIPLRILWKLLLNYFFRRLWKHISFKSLFMDITRLGLFYNLKVKNPAIRSNFEVWVGYRSKWNMLCFMSSPKSSVRYVPEKTADPESLTNQFDLIQIVASLQNGRSLLEWDHSQVDTHLEFNYHKKTHSLDMGLDGHYRFQALMAVAEFMPEVIVDLLRSITEPGEHV